ncbi:hemerythrin domain-containing protein [Humibacillus xanthopallidus]|uniref:Putative membrane protein n=1 Tax=Humibacillus xanthopallidus TaxID=412689 RepID=A0A543HJK2_9MICO|nr:hemerythrin domain-containing protein [Humibacillus xanthopallidus]TQM58505.1 putative membrane protein [Humibacillus xanthopallidus]
MTSSDEHAHRLPAPARAAVALEDNGGLDPAVDTLRSVTAPLDTSPLGAVLRGEWLGHALHPSLSDLPLGMWTATTALDLFGGTGSRDAARRLVGMGLLAAAPTALSGWAEWRRADRRSQRVGVAHAALNATAAVLYAGSWSARRRDRHRVGAVLALAGAGAAGAAGYLGGHLTAVRKVSSRHPAFAAMEGRAHGGSDDTKATAGSSAVSSAASGTPVARRRATPDEVIGAIAAQHARITTLITQVGTAGPDDRPARLRDLLGYLAGHEAVEEELLHPLLRVGNAHEVAQQRVLEEEGVGQQLEHLEQLDPASPSFSTQFDLIEDAIMHHARAEEAEELPRLAGALSEADAALVLSALAAQEAAAPKRRGSFAEMLAAAKNDVRALDIPHA